MQINEAKWEIWRFHSRNDADSSLMAHTAFRNVIYVATNVSEQTACLQD